MVTHFGFSFIGNAMVMAMWEQFCDAVAILALF